MSQFFASGGQNIGVSASASVLLMNEYSGLISFRMDWLDILAVQGTRKSLLHHHSSKASILQCSAFFIVQLSHPYMTTGKTIASTRLVCWQSNVSAFLICYLGWSLLFFQGAHVFSFQGCSHHLQWFWSPPKNKVSHCFHCLPIYLPRSDGTSCHDIHFLNIEF